jgi:hypothetical protein
VGPGRTFLCQKRRHEYEYFCDIFANLAKLRKSYLYNIKNHQMDFTHYLFRYWCSTRSGGIARTWSGLPRRLFYPGREERCACVRDSGAPSTDPGRLIYSFFSLKAPVLGIRIQNRILRIHYSEVRIRILPFSLKNVERTEILPAKLKF